MISNEKCKAIIEQIVAMCNRDTDKDAVISFGPDWGGNSLTIYIAGLGHTHVGDPESSFDEFIDQLHAQLCCGQGLSFV